jgi:hypothetical protein
VGREGREKGLVRALQGKYGKQREREKILVVEVDFITVNRTKIL